MPFGLPIGGNADDGSSGDDEDPWWKKALKVGMKVGQQAALAQDQSKPVAMMSPTVPALKSYKKGGVVAETGPAMLHKGEIVIPNRKMMHEHEKMRSEMIKKRHFS